MSGVAEYCGLGSGQWSRTKVVHRMRWSSGAERNGICGHVIIAKIEKAGNDIVSALSSCVVATYLCMIAGMSDWTGKLRNMGR